MAFYAGAFQPTSVALVAKKLGAMDAGRRTRGRFATADTAEAAAEVWQTVVAEESTATAEAVQEDEADKAEDSNPGKKPSPRASSRQLSSATALPQMEPAVVHQRPQALPRPGCGLQRSGAENVRQSVIEACEASGWQPPHASEGALISCSPAESSSTPLNEQRVDKESLSKLERIRKRKASMTAGDDIWGSTSKERPGRETFRGRGAVSSRNDGDSSIQKAEEVPQGGSLPDLQLAEKSEPKLDASVSSFGGASFEASRPRRSSASLDREIVFRV